MHNFQLVAIDVHIRFEMSHAGETLQDRVNFLQEKAGQMRKRKVRPRTPDAEMYWMDDFLGPRITYESMR